MNKELRKILNFIKKDFYTVENVIAILSVGSLSEGKEDYFSDMDLIFYLKDLKKEYEVLEKIESIFNKLGYKILRKFKRYEKIIIYIFNEELEYSTKIEIFLSLKDKVKEHILYLANSEIKDIKNCILFDKGNIYQILKKNSVDLEENIDRLVDDSINGFFYYYDGFLLNFTRGDIFRAYMNYTITFYKLASLLALSYGNYKYLFQPKELTKRIIKDKNLVEDFYNLSSDMKPLNMFHRKEQMEQMFFYSLELIENRFNLVLDKGKIKSFLDFLKKRYYPFFNFRDISLIINFLYSKKVLKPKKIYRSASLDRYNHKIVKKFLAENNINLVIDLRNKEELNLFEDRDKSYLKLENLYSEPFYIPKEIKSYSEILEKNKKPIKNIFEKYLSNLENKSIVIHCEHGQDRVGILTAIILDLLNIKREYIIEDYKLSFGHTDTKKLLEMFKYIDNKYKNTELFLTKICNINSEVLKNIKNILKVNENE